MECGTPLHVIKYANETKLKNVLVVDIRRVHVNEREKLVVLDKSRKLYYTYSICLVLPTARKPPFQGENRGSIPLRGITQKRRFCMKWILLVLLLTSCGPPRQSGHSSANTVAEDSSLYVNIEPIGIVHDKWGRTRNIHRFDDVTRGVTCYIAENGDDHQISCVYIPTYSVRSSEK